MEAFVVKNTMSRKCHINAIWLPCRCAKAGTCSSRSRLGNDTDPTNQPMPQAKSIISTLAVAALLTTVPPTWADESDILLKVLVRKGVLTENEATAVKGEVAKEKEKQAKLAAKNAPGSLGSPGGLASKLDISKSVETLKLGGDLRLRYQYDDKDAQFEPGLAVNNGQHRSTNSNQRSRWRFRLRLDGEAKLSENWTAGVQLQTNNASDSGNQDFKDGFSDYNIYISKAFLRWQNDWMTVSGGKFDNPFYTTDLVWDPDINPNGLAERIDLLKLLAGAPENSLAKDGKTLAPAMASPWELSFVAGQFIFDDNPESLPDNDNSTDAYIFETQLIASYKFGNGAKLTLAPGWFFANAASVSDVINANSFVDHGTLSGANRDLNILLLPGDVSFTLAGIKTKVLWDFAYNIEGRKRAENILGLTYLANNHGQRSDDGVIDPDDKRSKHSAVDDLAFLVGFQLGENKKKGDWSFRADYRQTGIAALDPNLNDDDFALGELNTRGFHFVLGYNLTDFATFSVRYDQAWNLRQELYGGEVTGGNAIGDSNAIRSLFVDLMVKF